MPGSFQTYRYAVSACSVAGIFLSAPRRHLLEVLSEAGVPRVVESLVRSVSGHFTVHPVTIYRFVAALEERGIVHRLRLRGHRAVMLACESLDYLVCDRCGDVTRLSMPEGFREWEGALAASTGFRLEHHWFEVSGICRGCQDGGEGKTGSQGSEVSEASEAAAADRAKRGK